MYGAMIMAAREKAGLKPSELAARMNCSRQRIYEIERSEHLNTKTIQDAAEALGITFSELISSESSSEKELQNV